MKDLITIDFNNMLSENWSLFLLFLLFSSFVFFPYMSSNDKEPIYDNSSLLLINNGKDTKLKIIHQNPITKVKSSLETNITSTEGEFAGYNLFVLGKYSLQRVASLLITNMDGDIIVEKLIPFDHIQTLSTKFINSSTILMGTGSLTEAVTLWNFETDTLINLPIPQGHHEYEYNPINKTIFTFGYYTVDIGGTKFLYDSILEYDTSGNLVWSLNTSSFISPTQWCPFQDTVLFGTPPSLISDITHFNSIFYDAEDDALYFNARNTNTFYKIDHRTGDVIWGLGEYGTFTLFDKYGVQRDNLFYHAHGLEKIDDNTFILFDNDLHNQTNPNNRRSRLLEIKINTETLTANESWSWLAPSDYYCSIYGDADRLPNGNRLGTFGGLYHPISNIGARLVEVNNNGQIVWEMDFLNSEDSTYRVYQMDRFHFSPILNSPSNIQTLLNENAIVNWQTWYNFRSRHSVNGAYTLYLDDQIFDSGSHTFDKFWRPTNLTVNLGQLPKGDHNVTIVVADEGGHITTDSLNITSTAFYLHREGPECIELGQENSLVQWKGGTVSPLTANITVNTSLISSFEWTGTDIILDLNSLELGNHNITLQLFNNTNLIYKDNFWVSIYPLAPPVIISFPLNQSITWNDSLLLSWEIFDHCPSSWSIFVNDSRLVSNSWENQTYKLNWTLPLLNEGLYNITLAAYDRAGHRNTTTTWLSIFPPSPPIIAAVPQQTEFQWQQETISLTWEVHGGTNWTVWKNGTAAFTGEVTSNNINIQIDNWDTGGWFPGLYNLTLHVNDTTGAFTTSTSWIWIVLRRGDAYANTIQSYIWCLSPEKALGAPDGEFAEIYLDYSSGHLTLDMGNGEEIIDGDGLDLTVIAQGGNYSVFVSNELEETFKFIGRGTGNTSFDLVTSDLSVARYITIEYYLGDTIELDAIVAINYNRPTKDNDPPQIVNLADFWVWENQTEIMLTWEVSDATPMNYSILINNTLINSGSWGGSSITYTFDLTGKNGIIQITLVLYDLFGNHAEDTVTIEIRPLKASIAPYSFFAFLIGIVILMIRKRRPH